MSTLLSEKTDRVSTVEIEPKNPAKLMLALSAFLTGLLPCLMHNLLFCESRIMLATDGKHFLTTVSLLVEYIKHYAGTAQAAHFLAESQLPGHFMLDGPLMSLIYAPVFVFLNKIPGPRDWQTLALGQSLFHAFSTALLSAIVLRLTKSPLFAFMSAVLFGLYPAAALQSGHFMSELPVCSILLILLLSLTSTKKTFLSFLLAGLSAGLLILSKPALILGVAIASLLGLARSNPEQNKGTVKPQGNSGIWKSPLLTALIERREAILGLALGFLIIATPWSIFTFKSTGSFLPTAQRQPLYNVACGWNLETDGWACNPHTPSIDVFSDSEGPLPTAIGIWISHPQESLRLAVSKLSRLSACPWNDFKGRAIGLDENAQILFHRLLIACAAFGAGIYAFCARRYLNYEQRTIIVISMALILSHLAYVMVECQPRYGFTAIPFAVLLAVFGIWQASRLSFQDPFRRLIIVCSVAGALGLTALLLHAENFCHFTDPLALKERAHNLTLQDRVEKVIDLQGINLPQNIKSVVLLVDGDKNLEKSKVEVNGVVLKERLLPAMHFDSQHYALYDQLREFGPAMRISVNDFRQWRAIPIDTSLINWQSKNSIIINSLAKSATIFGDRRKTRQMLSPDYCNYGILAAAPFAAGAESRVKEPVLTASPPQESYYAAKGESKTALKDSLRIRLLVNFDSNSDENAVLASIKPPVKRTIEVNRESFDRMLWDSGSQDCLRINKVILYAARTVAAEFPVPEMDKSAQVKIRITGDLKALKNAGDVGMLCALKGENGKVQILGKTPRALSAYSDWHKFQIEDIVPLNALGGKALSMELALYPCPWMEGQYGVSRRATDALFRNITIEVSEADLPSLSGRRIIY